MRPRIKALVYTIHGTLIEPKPVLHWGWNVSWEDKGKMIITHFWTWEAALDFAVERVLDFRKVNHLHLWN